MEVRVLENVKWGISGVFFVTKWYEVRTGMRWGGKGAEYQKWGTSFEYLGQFSVHRRSSFGSNCSEFCSLLVKGIYSAL